MLLQHIRPWIWDFRAAEWQIRYKTALGVASDTRKTCHDQFQQIRWPRDGQS